jgi:hypothetical protein
MMEAQFPIFFVIALAAGAGLLAVFVLWISKHIANEKTRFQGIAIVAITVGVLLLGLLVTRSSHRPLVGIHDTPVPPSATTIIGPDGRIEVHAHHQPLPVEGRVATKLAWGPLTAAAVAVAVIVLLVTSRKGLAASLAGLGIAGAVLLMFVYAARQKQMVHDVVEARVATLANAPPAGSSPTTYTEPEHADHATNNSSGELTAEANTATSQNTDHSIDDDKSKADDSAKAEATAEASPTVKEATKAPAPAWIDDEPTMEAGIYRAAVVSGPYSTKRECEVHLDDALRKGLMEYGESQLRASARYAAWVDIRYVRDNMIEDRYLAEERYENPLGKMYNLHVRLKVEPRDVARFEELARRSEERRAVETASAGGVFVFGALVVLYGGLRFLGRKKRASPTDAAPPAPAEASA